METYLEEGDLTVEQLKAGVRALTIASEAYPVFCGTAFKNKGIQPVLNAVIDYLPSPLDVPPMIGHKPNDESVELTRSPDWDEGSEEHTSELQSRGHLVCRLLLEKTNNTPQLSRRILW